MRRVLPASRRFLFIAVYLTVIVVQLYLWPECEDGSNYNEEELDLPPLPSNPLNPPMWNSKYPYHHCGTWQKPYTQMHRAVTNGSLPSSYLVYSTGAGFPPIIEGIPEAMKGIATVFMLALLTDRVFILDWKFPPGFTNILTYRYIDWTGGTTFRGAQRTDRVHDIGSRQWFSDHNHSVSWYMTTDFDEFFTNEVEVIQSHSYDFTHALLRNRHLRHKISQFGLHRMHCRVCCVWQYLFKHSPSFLRVMNSLTKSKLKMTPSTDMMFINFDLPSDSLPGKVALQIADKTMKCAERVSVNLNKPIWVLASNNLKLLEELPKTYPIKPYAVFYNRERYMVDLQKQNSTKGLHLKIPRTEQNALLHFFLGFYLQLNSTVLFSSPRSIYSETMSSLRQFHHTRGKFLVYPENGCTLHRFRIS